MKCEDVVRTIPLYLYGEVSPSVEEMLEDHIAGCAACAQEFRVQKAVNAALDGREMSVPAGLLQECRGDLTRAVAREVAREGEHRPSGQFSRFGVIEWFRDLMHHGIPLRVPVG